MTVALHLLLCFVLIGVSIGGTNFQEFNRQLDELSPEQLAATLSASDSEDEEEAGSSPSAPPSSELEARNSTQVTVHEWEVMVHDGEYHSFAEDATRVAALPSSILQRQPNNGPLPASSCQMTNLFRDDAVRNLFESRLHSKKLIRKIFDSEELSMEDFREDIVDKKSTAGSEMQTNMAKYLLLEKLHDVDPALYTDLIQKNLLEALPLVYTPTVGLACQTMHMFIEKPRGLYLPAALWLDELERKSVDPSSEEGRRILLKRVTDALGLCGSPFSELDENYGAGGIMVVTDGSRILGLRDQGAGGMGIPMGKASLYVAAAGIKHERALPVMVDFGIDTENTVWIDGEWCSGSDDVPKGPNDVFGNCRKAENRLYFGIRSRRRDDRTEEGRQKHVYPIMDAFVKAVKKRWPKILLQWEDWFADKAFPLLDRHRSFYDASGKPNPVYIRSFNDDIQGTGSMTYGALLGAVDVNKQTIGQIDRFLFIGAGSAALGVADMIITGILHSSGKPVTEEGKKDIRKKFSFIDINGLLMKGFLDDKRTAEQKPFAEAQAITDRELACIDGDKDSFTGAGGCPAARMRAFIKKHKPQVLIGLSGVGQIFAANNGEALRDMVAGCKPHRPIVFALSNPKANSECTAEEAYKYTDNQAIFASGTKFPSYQGMEPSQGNNMFIFPGAGYAGMFGFFESGMSDTAFVVAAEALAKSLQDQEKARGSVLPDIKRVAEINRRVGDAVMQYSFAQLRGEAAALGYTEPWAGQPQDEDRRSSTEDLQTAPKNEVPAAGMTSDPGMDGSSAGVTVTVHVSGGNAAVNLNRVSS